MQSLFAFEQCKEANNTLAQDSIDQRFTADLNSMEVQDKIKLKKSKNEANTLYLQKFESQTTGDSEETAVNVAVEEALELYKSYCKKDFNFFKKNLVTDVEKINYWYYLALGLLLAFDEVIKSDKKNDCANYTNNRFVEALRNDTRLQSLLFKTNARWENDKSLVQGWFREVVKPDKTFVEYCKSATMDEEAQRAIVKHLTRKLILGETVINDYFSERNIRWTEDHDIVKSLVGKTIKSLDFEKGTIQIQKLSMDWEDDLVFMNTLFEKTIQIEPDNRALIANNTKNWEVDRLPLTDRIIIEMAITELINFPAIPIKVSINEYIELTKHYSTPKSPNFVNGILDVIAKELVAVGKVKKSGRGLIDNK